MSKSERFFVLILLIAIVLSGCDKTQIKTEIDEVKQKEMDTFYEKASQLLSNRNFNGSVLVAKEGVVYLAEGYGLADENSDAPNERETIYQIGSLTKSFTALAIMQLQEAGKLSVNDPIDKYFPNYPNDSKITIHHLLTHTSGIDKNPISALEFTEQMTLHNDIMDKNVVTKILEMAANKPLIFDPGTKYDYNNHGYSILGAIIESISGLTYGAYIEENICKPLGMYHTGYNESNIPIDGQAIDFYRSYTTNVPASYAYAGGGMHASVDDLYKWAQAITSNKLIDQASTEAMLTPYLEHYAYGWVVDAHAFMHTGIINGYRSLLVVDTASDYVIIILSNYPSESEVYRISEILTSYIEASN